jgi:hypothetical protein
VRARTRCAQELDAFPVQYLVGPCALLGILMNQDHYSPFEMVWAFSIYLEAAAILPQLFLLQKQGEVENLTSHCERAAPRRRAVPPPRRAATSGCARVAAATATTRKLAVAGGGGRWAGAGGAVDGGRQGVARGVVWHDVA